MRYTLVILFFISTFAEAQTPAEQMRAVFDALQRVGFNNTPELAVCAAHLAKATGTSADKAKVAMDIFEAMKREGFFNIPGNVPAACILAAKSNGTPATIMAKALRVQVDALGVQRFNNLPERTVSGALLVD